MKTKLIINPLNLIKETPEQRKERVRESGSAYRTRIVESKKRYNRKKFKNFSKTLDN